MNKLVIITSKEGISHSRVLTSLYDIFSDLEILSFRFSNKSNPFILLNNLFQFYLLVKKYKYKTTFLFVGDLYYLGIVLPYNKRIAYNFDFNVLTDKSRKRSVLTLLSYKLKNYYPLSFFKSVTTISEIMKIEFEQHLPGKTCRILPNAFSRYPSVNLKKNYQFSLRGDKIIRILAFGHTYNKNLSKTIKISEALVNHFEVCLTVVNDNSKIKYSSDLISIERKYSLSDDEMEILYSESDLLLFPSLYEGFGMPIIEAAFHSLRIITSNIDPMNKLLDQGPLLIEPSIHEEIPIDAVLSYLLDEYDPIPAYNSALNYSTECVKSKYTDILSSMLNFD
jgi:glycosyltransferase involved in cell wall biosynthesis